MNQPHLSLLDEVSLHAPWELTEAFSRHPRWRPEDVNAGADMIVERLRMLGAPVAVHEPEIYLSIPFDAEVRAGGRILRAKPPAYAISAPDGVTAEVAYAPAQYSKTIGTLFNKNNQEIGPEELRGKIVVSEGFAFPQKIREFEDMGAVGVIAINPGVDIHWGICTSIWGTPDLDDLPRKPKIPVAAVNNPDGQELIRLAGTGGAATLVTRLEEGWYRQKVPVVEIRGREEPEKFVLLHGHYDSWDVGVGDNATGDATLLEIARVLTKHPGRLRRTVRIAWWPGHSTGRYAGSTWFADAFALDLDENCVAQINCDSPGCRWATVFKDVSWTKETEAFAQRTIKAVTGLDSHGERPHRAGDYSFNNIGISSLMMLSSTMPDELREQKGYYTVGGCGGNIAWHTENDTMEIADSDIMLRDIKVYLTVVVGIADAEILPFDWRAQVDEFAQTIELYKKAAAAAFDLGPAASACASLGQALDRFYAEVEAGRIAPQAANAVIQRMARILVPINYTRVPRFRHDPAIPIPPLPTIALATELKDYDPGKLGFAKTQLTRGQNRLVAALRQAERLVGGS
jgi:N-acetylated-alpha-linked acidic dipeptidase